MPALFLELAGTVLFLFFSMVVLAPHGEVAKALPVVRLATHKLLVSVDNVVGLELLATTLEDNTWLLCCQIMCCLGVPKDLKALSHTVQRCTLSLLFAWSPHTDPIQQQHEFPHKPALNTCRSRCQLMITPLHVLLKLILVLKMRYQMAKLIFLRAINLARYLPCSILRDGRLNRPATCV